MSVPSGFQARAQELTDTLEQQKHRLEAEIQLQSVRKLALQKANARVNQIQRMTCDMQRRAEEISSKIDGLEKKRGAVHTHLEDTLYKIRMLAEQIIDLEQERDQTSEFFEKNKDEMENHHRKIQEHRSGIEQEINELQKQYEELKRSSSERKRQISEVDAAIEAEEDKPSKLSSMKEEIIHEIASNSKKVEKLETALQVATIESKKREAELIPALLQRKEQVNFLQAENQVWEAEVYQRTRKRSQMQSDLEMLENRVAQISKALYG